MILIPYKVDIPWDYRPVMNWLVVAVITVVFILQIQTVRNQREQVRQQIRTGQKVEQRDLNNPFEPYILYGWTIKGLLGHMWLHGGLMHVAGNLIFLWLFGNAICSKIGNFLYLPIYILLGVTAAVFHQTFIGGPMLGASGAINGIVGMYLVFFPENLISCVFVLFFPLLIRPFVRTFSVSGIWMVLLWFAFDIWGLIRGGGHVAYWAHVGGFLAGFGLAVLLLKLKLITMERDEKSLFQFIRRETTPAFEDYRRDISPWQRDFIDSQEQTSKKIPTLTKEPIPPPLQSSGKQPTYVDKPSKTPAEPLKKPKDRFLHITCSCGKKLKVPLAMAGKTGICPACKKRLKVPEKNFVRMTCSCGKHLKVPISLAGKDGTCPNCKRRFKIPNSLGKH